jgi:hypothetical protein
MINTIGAVTMVSATGMIAMILSSEMKNLFIVFIYLLSILFNIPSSTIPMSQKHPQSLAL